MLAMRWIAAARATGVAGSTGGPRRIFAPFSLGLPVVGIVAGIVLLDQRVPAAADAPEAITRANQI